MTECNLSLRFNTVKRFRIWVSRSLGNGSANMPASGGVYSGGVCRDDTVQATAQSLAPMAPPAAFLRGPLIAMQGVPKSTNRAPKMSFALF